MVVTAHPDDEAGGFGGSLSLYASRGIETAVVCLTPGQAATHRGTARNDDELAEIRRQEFAASCKILQVSYGVVLNYPDGQLYRQEVGKVVREVALHIRKFRPQVLLSFGPEGGITAHPDHSMASIFASLAVQWTGQPQHFPDQLENGITPHRVQKFYYQTTDFTLPNRPPVSLPPATTVIEIGDYFETKITAFRAHVTQQPLWSLFESNIRPRGRKEMFHLAACSRPRTLEREADLFAGIEE